MSSSSLHQFRVGIIGGGPSGVYAARLLDSAGIKDYVLIEARSELGGRLCSMELSWKGSESASSFDGLGEANTVDRLSLSDRFDVGATWLWPMMQPELAEVVRSFGLQTFAQYEYGDFVVEQSPASRPQRYPMDAPDANGSMRIVGGTQAFVTTCADQFERGRVRTGQAVQSVVISEIDVTDGRSRSMEIRTRSARSDVSHDDVQQVYHVDHVFLAVPPRLALQRIDFQPPLPAALSRSWAATPTWMASAAKYVAVYTQPFWREKGMSGEGFSRVGPLGDIHDASSHRGAAALFGFFAIGPADRRKLGEDGLIKACRAQLARLFGAEALEPIIDVVRDWATEEWTAAHADVTETTRAHSLKSAPVAAQDGVWRDKMTGIGSEWSHAFPGFLAGAVDASDRGVKRLLQMPQYTSNAS